MLEECQVRRIRGDGVGGEGVCADLVVYLDRSFHSEYSHFHKSTVLE